MPQMQKVEERRPAGPRGFPVHDPHDPAVRRRAGCRVKKSPCANPCGRTATTSATRTPDRAQRLAHCRRLDVTTAATSASAEAEPFGSGRAASTRVEGGEEIEGSAQSAVGGAAHPECRPRRSRRSSDQSARPELDPWPRGHGITPGIETSRRPPREVGRGPRPAKITWCLRAGPTAVREDAAPPRR